jgi:hypothetical protein
MSKVISALAKANERIKKLETIIGKMVIDTPMGGDTSMLDQDEQVLADQIADEYFAENNTGSGVGKLYDPDPSVWEEVERE